MATVSHVLIIVCMRI